MPTVEVSLPTDLEAEFDRVVEDEFVNREEAAETLLRLGIDAYSTDSSSDEETDFAEEYADEMFDTAEDPSARFDEDEGAGTDFR
ncbi:MAG: CopG family transcriptional regulator [Haloferacaceae archaeon]